MVPVSRRVCLNRESVCTAFTPHLLVDVHGLQQRLVEASLELAGDDQEPVIRPFERLGRLASDTPFMPTLGVGLAAILDRAGAATSALNEYTRSNLRTGSTSRTMHVRFESITAPSADSEAPWRADMRPRRGLDRLVPATRRRPGLWHRVACILQLHSEASREPLPWLRPPTEAIA